MKNENLKTIYLVVERNEDGGYPECDMKVYLDKDEATKAYEQKVEDLCNIDPDEPVDESELDGIYTSFKGDCKLLDGCCDSGSLVTLYLLAIKISDKIAE